MRATLILAAFLIGCGPTSSHCEDDCNNGTPTDPDCSENCGTTADGEATVQYNTSWLGEPFQCLVYADGEELGQSNQPLTTKPGTYEFEAGDARHTAPDGTILHNIGTDEDPVFIGFERKDPETLNDGDNLVFNDNANRVFWGNYQCTAQACLGATCDDPIVDGPKYLEIQDGRYMDVDVSSGVLASWDSIEVTGDTLNISDNSIVEIISSQVELNGDFSFQIRDNFDRIIDATCLAM